MKTEEDMKDGLQRASEDTQGSSVDNADVISASFWVQSWMSYMWGILLWGGVRSSKHYRPQTERADCLKVVRLKGMSQSPLTIDRATLLVAHFSLMKSINSDAASLCSILYIYI